MRLWVHPPGRAAIEYAEGKKRKAFQRCVRESADTWLFFCLGSGDLATSSYAASKRYVGQAIRSTMGKRPAPDDATEGLCWGREVGKFPWPAVPWASVCGGVDACRPSPQGAAADVDACRPSSHGAAQAASPTGDPHTCVLPFKALALLQGPDDALGTYVLGQVLNAGTHARVRRATDQSSMKEVAIKLRTSKKTVGVLAQL